MKYGLDELFPLIQELSKKYTQNSSTSIPYETAQQLMEAILYCINEKSEENEALVTGQMPANAAYETGYQVLIKKIEATLQLYDQIMKNYNDYGNTAYKDTVFHGLPEFFRRYDPQFCPQDHLLTLDYPVLVDLHEFQGGDLIVKYVNCIWLEQQFLAKLPVNHVTKVLSQSPQGYQDLFVNLCAIVVKKILCSMLIHQKDWEITFSDREYRALGNQIKELGQVALSERLTAFLQFTINSGFDRNEQLFNYLKNSIDNMVVELINGAEREHLHLVV